MDREYIRLPKTTIMPDSSRKKRTLNDDFWINLIHYHLLKFYREFNITELNDLIETEKVKPGRKHIEDLIKDYMKTWFENYDRRIFFEGIVVNLEPKVKYNQPGFYDIKFEHSDWINNDTLKLKYYSVECKNLNSYNPCINEYVFNASKKDGGVYRHFNGKYCQENNYGGMLGFVLAGDINKIKDALILKLKQPFDNSPEGDLIDDGIILDSIEGNNFTFNSKHRRLKDFFTLHHFLFKVYA
ncbi:hypothetical protein AAEO56_00850 [Flavobacterium sp. DGU11]|uniref:Uncharacterized protein n=1 Tax=Flavobacterium arundinis TaxID=3139143 RepID=A0ABU9HRL4_9FLAO